MTSENTGWGLGVERSELEMPADNDRMSTIRAKPWPNAKTQMPMRRSRAPIMSHIRTTEGQPEQTHGQPQLPGV